MTPDSKFIEGLNSCLICGGKSKIYSDGNLHSLISLEVDTEFGSITIDCSPQGFLRIRPSVNQLDRIELDGGALLVVDWSCDFEPGQIEQVWIIAISGEKIGISVDIQGRRYSIYNLGDQLTARVGKPRRIANELAHYLEVNRR